MTMLQATLRDGLTGRHVLAMFCAFFAVVLAVNFVMLYAAISTYSGVVSVEPYVKGLHYNDRVAAEAAQQKLGWRVDVTEPSRADGLKLTALDAAGRPLSGLTVNATLGRPASDILDRHVALSEIAPGVYALPLADVSPGAWIVDVRMHNGADATADETFRLRRRLWLKP